MSKNIKWICIYKTTKIFEAEVVKGNIEAANIPAVILNKRDSSYQAFGIIEVHIPEQNKEQVLSIINNSNNFKEE